MANSVSDWFMQQYLAFLKAENSVKSLREFSAYLGVTDKALSTWMNGRNNPSYSTAVKISQRLEDFTLLDLLNYPRPAPADVLSALPEPLRSSLVSALTEVDFELKTRGLTNDSPEAREIIKTAFSKHGFDLNVIEG
jgi:transcriptional regulator with XRE-family HTH domain